MDKDQNTLVELLDKLGQDPSPYFSDTMVLGTNELDPSLPGLVWSNIYGTNSPRPSAGVWRSFPRPCVQEATPPHPEDVVIWLGQVLSSQVGRGGAVEILRLVVEHKPELLDEIKQLERFSPPTS